MNRLTYFLMVACFVLLVSSTAWSKTIHVKEGATGDGSNWANAYGLLQDALDDADPNDEIWVAAGTYKPTSDYGLDIGDRGKHFRMKNRVAIYGGFPNTGDPVWEECDPNTHETILSGDLMGDDGIDWTNRSDNCYHVFFHPEETNLDPNSVLDSFTITGGNAFGDGSGGYPFNHTYYGGGMYNWDYSSPTVTNCTFSDNSSGMFNGYSSPTVTNCTFIGNSAGGINNVSSNPTVMNCSFNGNTAPWLGGGGMFNDESNPNVTNCIFIGNSAGGFGGGGGGMCNDRSSPTVTNCNFIGNSVSDSWVSSIVGGGMLNWGSDPNLTNCILWSNSSGQISNVSGSAPTVTYSDVQGGYPGTGNIDADPMFKDPNGPDNITGTEDDNLQLAYNSPCIDAGDNTAVPLDTADLDDDGDTTERIPLDLAGNARFTDDPLTTDTGVADPPDYPAVVDMGPYERYEFCGGDVVSQALKGDLNLDCFIDLLDFAIMASYWLQYIGPE